ncbi:MAG TPA: hypothetical protein VI854_05890 [Acidimicrobiia bacterium]|nr:hypothetical protein [Acidimicrobiia bacterium]
MPFVQIMEFTTSRIDEIEVLDEEWLEATKGRRTMRRQLLCADRNRPNTYLVIVEFDSYEQAMENSQLPETHDIAGKMAALCDEPPRFIDLDVRTTH